MDTNVKDIKKLFDEYNDKKDKLDSMPACIYIESVKGCPYSCAMCPVHFSKKQNISRDLLEKISPYFKYLDVLAIHGDGEPLLGDINYFVEQAVKNDFVLHMNSTGFFLTKELADVLLKARLSIRFSIHSGSKESYMKIMGNKFEKVLENITYLVKKSKESKNDSDFWFSFIIMKENIDEIEEFLKIAHNVGISHVRFMKLIPNRESIKGIKMPNRDFKFSYLEQYNRKIIKKFIDRLPSYKKLAKDLGIKIEVGSMESSAKKPYFIPELINKVTNKLLFGKKFLPLKKRKGMCVVPWFGQLIISQNGDVKLCCSYDAPIGNINDSTLEEIWNNDIVRQFRSSFSKGEFPKLCGYCRGLDFSEYPGNSIIRNN
jgi:MoaA/NifB/PqqE/SkfB family radical SAM enzyme